MKVREEGVWSWNGGSCSDTWHGGRKEQPRHRLSATCQCKWLLPHYPTDQIPKHLALLTAAIQLLTSSFHIPRRTHAYRASTLFLYAPRGTSFSCNAFSSRRPSHRSAECGLRGFGNTVLSGVKWAGINSATEGSHILGCCSCSCSLQCWQARECTTGNGMCDRASAQAQLDVCVVVCVHVFNTVHGL